jgi:tetratricopeptide (TPR) repeat protein
MPSLSALNEFRDSFSNIANEKNDVISRNLPFDDFTLPDTEAPAFDPASFEEPAVFDEPSGDIPASPDEPAFDEPSGIASAGLDQPTGFDMPAGFDEPAADAGFQEPLGDAPSGAGPPDAEPPGATPVDVAPAGTAPSGAAPSGAGPSAGDFDFSAFFGGAGASPVSDLGSSDPPSLDDLFAEASQLSDNGLSPTDDFSQGDSDGADLPEDDFAGAPDSADWPDEGVPPDGLLAGLSDEIESAPSDFQPEDGTADSQSEDFSADDFNPDAFGAGGDSGEIPDFNFDNLDSGDSADDDEGSLDLGGERQDGTLSTGSDDFSAPEDTPVSEDEMAQDDLQFPQDEPPSGFDLPDDAAMPAPSQGGDDFDLGEESIDLGGESPDLDLGGESPDLDIGGESPDSGGESLSLGGEDANGNLVLDDVLPDTESFDTNSFDTGISGGDSGFDGSLPDFDLPDTGGEPAADSGLGDSLPDFDLPDTGGEPAADSGFDGSLPDIDLPDTGGEVDLTPNAGDEDTDGLPSFDDLGGDFASESIDLETETSPDDLLDSGPVTGGDFGGDDFALPGLDEIFDKKKNPIAPPPPPKKGGLFGKKKAEPAVEQERDHDAVEEIQLSQEDLEKLLETLAAYPLNLRVACEELIAEKVLLPQQLSKLIRLLIRGAHAKETAEFAGEILGKPIVIPKSFEKSSGEAWEEEKASFAYIFVHNFLPVLRLFAFIAVSLASLIYLGYRFIYIPHKAETIYQRGYERIFAGEYQRANELFHEAFITHRNKDWFYKYAEGFRDQRRYMLAEAKYEELLRYYPRDKKGVLDYAALQTYYLLNYEKANNILQQQLLDYAPNDFEGLMAAGDNFLLWGDSDPEKFSDKYEDARFAFARLLENYGWQGPIVERMLKYFIRTDDLKEVIYLRDWFDGRRGRKLSPESLAELGGYLLDKQLEEVKGVPNPYVAFIESVRDMLLEAVREKPELPEPHYHLARYYKNLGNVYEERLTLENAIRAFDLAETETIRRRLYRVDTHYRYANLLINNREFFPAEEQLVRGIELYEDFLSRNLISASPQLGELYAVKGDLEYFVKSGDMQAALGDYHTAERYGYAPPEIQYRMGSAYYQLEDWRNALDYLFKASADLPLNRRMLYALGNTAYRRGDFFAAQGYYNRLLDTLENQRTRQPVLLPNDRPDFIELGERLMVARNNAGVVYEALADQTGNREYRSRAMSLYAESASAWDSVTRNPQTMIRMRMPDSPDVPSANLGFLNAGNALRPVSSYSPQIFPKIDKDALETSRWENLAASESLAEY